MEIAESVAIIIKRVVCFEEKFLLTQSSVAHTCPMVHFYWSQREHERCPGCLLQCSSYLSAARTGETVQLAVSHDTYFNTFIITPLSVQHFKTNAAHSLSAYSAHSLRCGSGLGVALCFSSGRHTPSEWIPPISRALKYMQANSAGRGAGPISAAANQSGKEISTLDSGKTLTWVKAHANTVHNPT